MTTVLSRPRRADVRARILEAAARAFFANRYAATRLADIATEAGFTKGAVYSNFGGKPELFSAVFAERAASITGIALHSTGLLADGDRSRPEPAAAPERDALDAVATSLTEQVAAASAGPLVLAEFLALAARDADVRAAYATLRTQQARQLEDQLRGRAGELSLGPSFDFALAANLLLTVTNALATEHAAAPEATPPDLIHDSLLHLLRSLVRG